MSHPTKIWIIAGPTASGKTSLGIEVAKEFKAEIINFDCRQLYQEMNIGVARPSEEELTQIKHHLVGSHSVTAPINAQSFRNHALDCLNDVVSRTGSAVLVGGTGLYLKALLHGFDSLPKTSAETREKMELKYQFHGLDGLLQDIHEVDPLASNHFDVQNTARVKRIWEILHESPKPLTEHFQGKQTPFPYPFKVLYIDMPRNDLYYRINQRVDRMIDQGLEKEVRSLIPFKDLSPLKTLGYSDFFDYFDGHRNLNDTISLIKQKTRNYAKRQMTWFRNQQEGIWDTSENLLSFIKNTPA
jgi:tRNA dimethylallyltransferase